MTVDIGDVTVYDCDVTTDGGDVKVDDCDVTVGSCNIPYGAYISRV